jgi:hypothetical protein
MDVHAPDAPPYRLEVSSPGLDRPVGKFDDFIALRAIGPKFALATAVNGRKILPVCWPVWLMKWSRFRWITRRSVLNFERYHTGTADQL